MEARRDVPALSLLGVSTANSSVNDGSEGLVPATFYPPPPLFSFLPWPGFRECAPLCFFFQDVTVCSVKKKKKKT